MDGNLRPNSGSNSSVSTSPEFEFWMVRNPSYPPTQLVSADELFADGVILPLHRLQLDPNPDSEPGRLGSGRDLETGLFPETLPSKRWKDIFKKNSKKNERQDETKKREKRRANAPSGAELNINLWPFSRSRSAGNNSTRPRLAVTRKSSSAPCSRSNSAGESKSRRWPNSPRSGVPLGRNSPVWQVRRSRNPEPLPVGIRGKGPRVPFVAEGKGKPRVLSLNVPLCIGYSTESRCRTDQRASDVADGAGRATGSAVDAAGSRGGTLFNLRGLFGKKVVY